MTQYKCPYCSTQLNVNGHVVLSLKREYKQDALILLNEELGNYNYHVSPSVKIKEKENVNFHCPSCARSLDLKQDENKARIIKIDENGEKLAVIFSTIFGDHSTYAVSKERQMSYGEHALKYLDPTWYMKN